MRRHHLQIGTNSLRASQPILDQRLLGIEEVIGRSDGTIRDEFGRGREEAREGARSLREEVTGLFERFAGSLRASMIDLSTGQQAQLETFATRLNEAKSQSRRQMLAIFEKKSNRYCSNWGRLSAIGSANSSLSKARNSMWSPPRSRH